MSVKMPVPASPITAIMTLMKNLNTKQLAVPVPSIDMPAVSVDQASGIYPMMTPIKMFSGSSQAMRLENIDLLI